MEQNQELVSRDQSPYLQIYQTLNHKVEKLADGKMEVFQNVDETGFLQIHFKISYLSLTFSQNAGVIYNQNSEDLHEIFIQSPDQLQSGFYVIVVSKKEAQFDFLVQSLQEKFQFHDQNIVLNDDPNNIVTQQIKQHYPMIFVKPVTEDQQNKVGYYMEKSGFVIGEGLEFVGKKISQGTDSIGGYITSRVSDQVIISDERRNQIKNVSQKSKGFFGKISYGIDKILSPIAEKTNVVVESAISKTKNSESKVLKSIYAFGKSTNSTLTNIYRGATKGSKNVGDSVSDTSKIIIKRKFGEFDDDLNDQQQQQQLQQQYPSEDSEQQQQQSNQQQQDLNLSSVDNQQNQNILSDL